MYWFIEANGRFWGGLPLALAAGVDFPRHLVSLYQNQPVSQSAYSAGVRGRNLERDIDWTRSAVRHAGIPMTRIVSDALKLVLPREHIEMQYQCYTCPMNMQTLSVALHFPWMQTNSCS